MTDLMSLIQAVPALGLADAPAGAAESVAGTVAGPAWALLIPGLPLLGFVLMGLCALGRVKSKIPAWITVACLGGAFATTVALWQSFDPAQGAMLVTAWDWFDVSWLSGGSEASFVAPFGFYVDTLTIYWMLFVTGLATLIALYASEYMSHDVGLGYCRFFAAFCLFVFSMACLVMGENLVMLYLGWEGVGLCSYLLIGYFYKKPSAVAAAKKAFIVNRIGDLGLALGLYLTFVHFGTVRYAELFSNEQLLEYVALAKSGNFADIPFVAQFIPMLLMVGAFGKSAQFPLYVWLPDAMEGPTPVSALIHAATMVTAGVYLVARFYPVFLTSEWALPTVAWVGTITALLAATIGMAQFDIKRIMAYSTVSQLGYMFAGLGVLTPTGGAYHVLTHAFFKALLFLCCGAVMHGFAGQLDLRKLSGVWKMKGWGVVSVGMLVGCLNLAGFPLTAGFFSKDTILAEAFVTPGYQAIGWTLIFTAGLTAYYTFRVFFRVFVGPAYAEPGDEHHGDDDHSHDHDDHHGAGEAHGHGHGFHPHAPGWAINTVLAILAIASLAASGLYFVGGKDVTTPSGEHLHAKHYPAAMVLQSSAAYVTPYDHHAFHAGHDAGQADDAHTGDAGHDDGAHEAPGGALAPADANEAHAGVGPRGAIAEPLEMPLFGDPHKVMYYVSGVVGLVGILLAAWFHGPKGLAGLGIGGRTTAADCRMDAVARRFGPIPKWAEGKWYVDEFYDAVFRLPLKAASHVMHWFDKLVIDGLVNLFGGMPRVLASLIRPSQSGEMHAYAIGMVAGLAALLFAVLVIVAVGGGVL